MRYDWARWFKPLGSVTPVFNSLLQTGDLITDLFQKLQGLLAVRTLRSVITTAFSGGASTVADVTITSVTIPAGRLVVGDEFDIQIRGLWTKPNSAGTTISFWVKSDTVKIIDIAYQPTGAVTNRPFVFMGKVVVRSVGGSGVLVGAGNMTLHTTATASINYASGGVTDTQNTTASFAISTGFTFSNSNASNNVTANIAVIEQG